MTQLFFDNQSNSYSLNFHGRQETNTHSSHFVASEGILKFYLISFIVRVKIQFAQNVVGFYLDIFAFVNEQYVHLGNTQ